MGVIDGQRSTGNPGRGGATRLQGFQIMIKRGFDPFLIKSKENGQIFILIRSEVRWDSFRWRDSNERKWGWDWCQISILLRFELQRCRAKQTGNFEQFTWILYVSHQRPILLRFGYLRKQPPPTVPQTVTN